MKKSDRKKTIPKRILRLPDLDYAKRSVLNSLGSPASKRAYEFGIDDFVAWYCSEPRLAFSRTVVLRYRIELESRRLAPSSINLRLAAVSPLNRLISARFDWGARGAQSSPCRSILHNVHGPCKWFMPTFGG
jgi:hypothetical protein